MPFQLALPLWFILALSGPVLAGDGRVPSASLETALRGLTTDRLFTTAEVGVQVVDLSTGEEVFSHRPDASLTPASTMKVVTAAAALKSLGPSFTYRTTVQTDGRVDSAGVLHGNLYVRGSGDPHLVAERLWKLARDVRLAGIQRIEGDLVFDETAFDDQYAMPGWDKQEDLERAPAYLATMGALSLNFNTVGLVVGPGAEPGQPARVQLETSASRYVDVVNDVTTGSARARRTVDITREVTADGVRFRLEGVMPEGSGITRFYRGIPDPTAHFVAAWVDMLRDQSVTWTGTLRRAAVPADGKTVAETVSPPLTAILMDMNKYSNNFMAEQVLRTLGGHAAGGPATTEKGLEVVDAYLRGLGVDSETYRLVNGSGLSREIRLQPSVLTAVLVDMAADTRVGQEFLTSLAIAGLDGTLSRRLTESPGRMRGKTGTMDGVHCLTGYLDGANGVRYAFAFLVNEVRGGAGEVKVLHDRFARQLLSLSEGDAVVEQELTQ